MGDFDTLPGVPPEFRSASGGVTPSCLIVGLGNSLMCDDGIGVHAARQLMENPPPDTLVLEVGTDVFSAISWLENVPWVLAIDAMDGGGAPGTIYVCDGSNVAPPLLPKSLHELGLLSILEFVPEQRRPAIAVLGVQPAEIECGLELSPALQQALPKVVGVARELVASRKMDAINRRAATR